MESILSATAKLTPIVNLLFSDRLASVLYDVTRIQLPRGCGGGKAVNTEEKVKTMHCKDRKPLVVASEQRESSVIVFDYSFVGRFDKLRTRSAKARDVMILYHGHSICRPLHGDYVLVLAQ